MLKKILKFILILFAAIVAVVVMFFAYFNLPVEVPEKDFDLGVTFSYRYSQDIGLNWQENYRAILDDLGVKNIRIPVYWDLIEREEGKYDFSNLEWQIMEAQKRDVRIILVVGQKVPRWPECFIPEWAEYDDEKRKKALKVFIAEVVNRYKDYPSISRWQVENEPFLKFGICPKLDKDLLDQEIAIVRNIDSKRPIVVTDSGELSLWIQAAKRADIFGTTMYRDVCSEDLGCHKYPIGPNFFKFKRWIIEKFAGQDDIIIVELQGEPWIDEWTVDAPLEKQLRSMNAGKLRENIEFAKKTGFSEIYVWGAEWWYWTKVKKDYPDVWDEAKNIYSQ